MMMHASKPLMHWLLCISHPITLEAASLALAQDYGDSDVIGSNTLILYTNYYKYDELGRVGGV
jgi:hypothetical protein